MGSCVLEEVKPLGQGACLVLWGERRKKSGIATGWNRISISLPKKGILWTDSGDMVRQEHQF